MPEEEGHTCPHCGSAEAIEIVYGLPSPEMEAAARRGEVLSGGCLCHGDERDHRWCCRSCGTAYGGVGQEPLVHYLSIEDCFIKDE
ncbi:MAG: hypothetical protein SWK76_01100 [Actinomycetota bacterium]|nr:hypothetical protein [Actinomycetota bacterium]